MNKNINLLAHSWIEESVNETTIAVDATAGNGKDTAFLSRYCLKVYAFDIQKQAISNSTLYNKENKNIIFILASHAEMSSHVKEKVDLIVFNLGYLPGGNKQIITTAESTKKALHESLKLLKNDGSIFITFYRGHPGGQKEYKEVSEEIVKLQLKIRRSYQYENTVNSPILLQLSK